MAQRATSLGPKPSLFFFFCFFVVFFCFPFFAFDWKPLFPPLKRPFWLFIFLCFPLFLFFSLFGGIPLFHFLFICLSLVIFFLPCFLFLMSISGSWCLLLFCLLFVARRFFFSLVVLFVLNHNLRFHFVLHLILFLLLFLFCFCCFHIFCFLIIGYLSETSLKYGNSKTTELKHAEKKKKTGHFDKNNLHRCVHKYFFIFVFYFAFVAESTIK